MPRTLITGGAGFIGSHLCDYFLRLGHEVICMDNLLTGDIANIAHIQHQNFLFIKHDVTNYIYVEGKLDYLLHFASPASPIDYEKLPIQTLKVGSLGTHKALGLAKEKEATFLLASTSEVYGDPLVHPQPEEYWGNVNPIGPRGVYDEAKRFAEAMTMAYHRVHGVDTRIIRIFNTYGPRMRLEDGRAIPSFITQALRGEDISVFGDGSQTRAFSYIAEVAPLMAEAIDIPECRNQIFNVGADQPYSLNELAAQVAHAMGVAPRVVHLPARHEVQHAHASHERARQVFGTRPQTSLDEGLGRMAAWVRSHGARASSTFRDIEITRNLPAAWLT